MSGTKWRREGGNFVLTDYRVNEIIVHARRNYIGILFHIHTQYHMFLRPYSSLSITIGTLHIKIQSNLLKRLNLLVRSYKNVIVHYLIPNVRTRTYQVPSRSVELIFFRFVKWIRTALVWAMLSENQYSKVKCCLFF